MKRKIIPVILVFWFIFLMIDSVQNYRFYQDIGFLSKVEVFYSYIIHNDFDAIMDILSLTCFRIGSSILITYLFICTFFQESEKSEKSEK
ncbi:hypothetical protein EHW64_17910 [Erwinia psidii]|uniref:hypothetical protein n=1 Tax=Erwinia psidii TaxID=69224 RepID=UPI00226B6F43|nr:hypothetical protein [Erwinia psidii]MCX8959334.1 hypothetical protein [Erwinia psidii]MCX8962939.1 hypothetical protein [Erwinia psidii]